MLTLLKSQRRYSETLFLCISTLSCLGLSLFRYFYTDSRLYLFLNWNLFLAFIPWALSSIFYLKPELQNKKGILYLLMFVWLLFFPNAPYILTDLSHLRIETTVPIWFDLLLILSFAWTGLIFGFLSLWDIENILQKTVNSKWIRVLSICLLLLGSFGIYLGRYLRWNSWDIIGNPWGLLNDVTDRLRNPIQHPQTWGMTLFMWIFLNLIYWSFRLIKKRR